MKAETARLLRAVLRLIEDDLREVADSVVEIDEREAAHHAYAQEANLYGITTREMLLDAVDNSRHVRERFERRLSDVEAILADNANHSRRVQS